MEQTYDYYTEPCQLCLSRNGRTYDICGWCNEPDTHYKKKDGTYPGDWIRIPFEGYGYPFHARPHPTRKYFKNERFIENSKGKLPSDVTTADIDREVQSSKAIEDLVGLLRSNPYTINERIKEEDIQQIIDNEPLIAEIIRDRPYESSEKTLYQQAYFLIQAAVQQPVGMRLEIQRRFSLLKSMIFESVVLDKHLKIPSDGGLYRLAQHFPPDSDFYSVTARLVSACTEDLKILHCYNDAFYLSGLTILDLMEGEAHFMERLRCNKNPLSDLANLPKKYSNAWQYYVDRNGTDPIVFLVICHLSLNLGIVMDEQDLFQHANSPLALFSWLCAFNGSKNNTLEAFAQAEPVQDVVQAIQYVEDNKLSHDPITLTRLLVDDSIAPIFTKACRTIVFVKHHISTFLATLESQKMEPHQHQNLKELVAAVNSRLHGFGDEQTQAIKSHLEAKYPIITTDVFIPWLIASGEAGESFLLDIKTQVDKVKFYSILNDEDAVVSVENQLLDFTERLHDLAIGRDIMCCANHGVANPAQVLSCNRPTGVNRIFQNILSLPLSAVLEKELV